MEEEEELMLRQFAVAPFLEPFFSHRCWCQRASLVEGSAQFDIALFHYQFCCSSPFFLRRLLASQMVGYHQYRDALALSLAHAHL